MASGRKIEPSNSGSILALFIGCSYTFPSVFLRLVRAEIEGVDAVRLDDFDGEGVAAEHPHPRVVLFSERLAARVEHEYSEIQKLFPTATIVLAYRNAALARRLFAAQRNENRLNGLRFLPVDAPIQAWVSMLRLFLADQFVVPGDLIDTVKPRLTADEQNGPRPGGGESEGSDVRLTPRELEVLDFLANGYGNKKIACELGISYHTIKLHVHNIFSKIGVRNRTAAASWYLAQSRTNGDLRRGM